MPQRTSTADKKLKGTLRPCRESRGVGDMEKLASVPAPPAYLPADAVREWKQIAALAFALGTLTGADLRALALLAETLADIGKLRQVIESEGVTVETGSGGRKGHPALSALTTARQQAHTMLTSFGLNPRGRVGMAIAAPKESGNPFDAF